MIRLHASILVVDDEPMNRDVLSRRLEREGYVVAVAESGSKALEKMSIERFDLVLLDIMMPGMDGHEVLAAMKADSSLKDTPVIMVTAIADKNTAVKCLQAGASDYLVKPFNMGLAKSRIHRCLAASAQVIDIDINSGASRQAHILVVDDDPSNREILEDRIKKIGYKVDCAENGVEALKLLLDQRYDLVLLDIVMPEMDGAGLLQQMKMDRKLKHVPVIMISAIDDVKTIFEYLDKGATDYISKPFNTAELYSRLQSCLQAANII